MLVTVLSWRQGRTSVWSRELKHWCEGGEGAPIDEHQDQRPSG